MYIRKSQHSSVWYCSPPCVHVSWAAGMQGFYEVLSCDNATAPTALPVHVRRYYIAAEEVLWDYAPSGKNGLTNKPLNESERWIYIPKRKTYPVITYWKTDWNSMDYILTHIITHCTLLCKHVLYMCSLLFLSLQWLWRVLQYKWWKAGRKVLEGPIRWVPWWSIHFQDRAKWFRTPLRHSG